MIIKYLESTIADSEGIRDKKTWFNFHPCCFKNVKAVSDNVIKIISIDNDIKVIFQDDNISECPFCNTKITFEEFKP